jgi:hypothetical protein
MYSEDLARTRKRDIVRRASSDANRKIVLDVCRKGSHTLLEWFFARNFNVLAYESAKETKSHLPQTTEFALFFVHIQTGVTE